MTDRSDRPHPMFDRKMHPLTKENIAPALRERLHDLGEREAACAQHGSYISTGRRFFSREIWSQCPTCISEEEEAMQSEQRRRASERLERERQEAIGQACIPPRFQDRSFAAFVADEPAKLHALTVCRDFVEQFDAYAAKGSGLILAGLPGTGKTHLAASSMLELLARGRWVQYLTCMGLIRMIRETWRADSTKTEREVLSLLGKRIELLVIDEVGVQYGTDGEKTILFEVLDRRYSEMRPTILITNQNKVGFQEFVGERVHDRLRQTHTWVPFPWSSYRTQARKDAA